MRTLITIFAFLLLPFASTFAQKANAAQTGQLPTGQSADEQSSGEQTPTVQTARRQSVESVVYICDSKTSYAYHSSTTCRGLSRCTHGVVKLTRKEADLSRTPCKWCY